MDAVSSVFMKLRVLGRKLVGVTHRTCLAYPPGINFASPVCACVCVLCPLSPGTQCLIPWENTRGIQTTRVLLRMDHVSNIIANVFKPSSRIIKPIIRTLLFLSNFISCFINHLVTFNDSSEKNYIYFSK